MDSMQLFRNNQPVLELRPIAFLFELTNQPGQVFPFRLTVASEIDSSGQFTYAGTLDIGAMPPEIPMPSGIPKFPHNVG